MTLNLTMPEQDDLKPRITVFGVGGAGGPSAAGDATAAHDASDARWRSWQVYAPELHLL